MDILGEVISLIGSPESETLEYKSVLPNSRLMARLICAFANNKGGYILLGVKETGKKTIEVVGLSKDFYVNSVIHSAIDLLENKPVIVYRSFTYQEKTLFFIKIEKSDIDVKCEGIKYIRKDSSINAIGYEEYTYKKSSKGYVKKLNKILITSKGDSTISLNEFINHIQSILKVLDELDNDKILQDNERRILLRIIFSSCVDNFETYLSNLLLEIYLSNPNTLKTDANISVKEVLNCKDMQDFIEYYANQKIQKLQKGSVKGFLKDNKQISDLNSINENEVNEIEKILQIRHLYTHRNGIIDEKFIQYYPNIYKLHDEHLMNFEEFCSKIEYMFLIALKLDSCSINKYNLNNAN